MNDGTPIIIKKKKVTHGGHHGGAWKVAYADFVTAMMAFFLVMWIMGLSPEDRKIVQGYFNDPMGFMKDESKGSPNMGPPGTRPSAAQAAAMAQANKGRRDEDNELRSLKSKIEGTIGDGQGDAQLLTLIDAIEVNITPEGLELEFVEGNGVVFFELGSAVVRPQARSIISRVAVQLKASGRLMFVDGHTDARPFAGGSSDNKLLSTERAQAVYQILSGSGVLEDQVLAIRGRGDRKLKFPDKPYDAYNRRVSILLPFLGGEEKMTDDIEGSVEEQAKFAPPPVDLRPEKPELSHP